MSTTTQHWPARGVHWARYGAALLGVLALGGCSALRPTTTTPPAFYALETPPTVTTVPVHVEAARSLPTLVVTPPHAAPGFDSQRIIFVRADHQREYFASSEWLDPPARMLGPLLVSAMERSGAFAAVVLAPGSATGEQRLDTEIVRLQHNFQTTPSRVQFTLRAYLVDDKTRRVLAWREFSDEVAAASDTPQGGVVAANQAVQRVLAQLAQFVATGAR
jgi:cholesterol transport system auxiliary component